MKPEMPVTPSISDEFGLGASQALSLSLTGSVTTGMRQRNSGATVSLANWQAACCEIFRLS